MPTPVEVEKWKSEIFVVRPHVALISEMPLRRVSPIMVGSAPLFVELRYLIPTRPMEDED